MNNKITNSSINNIYNTSKNNNIKDKKEMSFQDQINETVKKLYEKAKDDRVVPEYGDFSPVYEEFENSDSKIDVDKYRLRIFKMPKEDIPDEKQRYIEASVYPKNSDYNASMLIGVGHKDKILEQLKSEDFPQKLNEAYIKLINCIEHP